MNKLSGVRLFHSVSQHFATARSLARANALAKRQENKAKQIFNADNVERIDPVLGKPDNPFMNRLRAEVAEPDVLAKGYSSAELEKLLFGAQESLINKISNIDQMGTHPDAHLKKMALEQEKSKRETILRILSMKNSNVQDKKTMAIEMARKEFQRFDGDTGSSEVQAAIMTVRINFLMDHIKLHPQDLDQVRKTRMLVQKRQRILRYLKRDMPDRYFWAIRKLGLNDNAVLMEFNMDRKYMEDFNVWPGRVLVKETKKEKEEKRKEKRRQKRSFKSALPTANQ